MKQNRLRFVILFTSLLIMAAIALGIWLYLYRMPSPADLFPLNDSGTSITILAPDDRSEFPADASIPILVSISTENPLSAVELWIDGSLVNSIQPAESGGRYYVHQFHWTPVRQGNVRVLARGISTDGRVTASNPLLLQISKPAGARLVSQAGDGSTISEIAFPVIEDASSPAQDPGPSQAPPRNLVPAENLGLDLALWAGSRFSASASLPEAPDLTYFIQDCQLTLLVADRSDDELGFFIYRSGPGSSTFQRIAELENPAGVETFSYSDPDPASGSIYYAAAFNSAGESPSPPVTISGLGPTCPGQGGAQSPDGPDPEELEILDLAYFYYSFDTGGYQRFPADPNGFLTPSEYPTSLKALAGGLASASSIPVREIDLVLWGWSGGKLVNLGAYRLEIDDSRLQVCNLGTGCTGDVASNFRSTYGELANDAEDQIREFYWSTNAPGTTWVLWQISTSPFSGDFSPHPYGLVAGGCSEGGSGGTFLVDFQDLGRYLPAPSSCGGITQPWLEFSRFAWESALFPGLETHYYIRFTPMAGSQPAGKPSNTVEILAKPGETFLEPVIVDHLPEIYQVEIADFSPVKNMDPRYWGCVSITGLDYSAIWNYYRSIYPPNISDNMISQFADKIYNDLNYAVQNNLVVCPAPYQGSSGSVISEWGSMLVESLQEIWDGVVSAFNALKAEIVDQVAGAINKLGIPCDTECRAGLKVGLEIGIAYFTGIPPNLPSFEQLKEQGIEYAIEMAAAEAGIPCPEECQQILREGLEDVVDAAAGNNTQPGCVNENWANALGKHSLCLPPGVETAAVPEGVSEPARALIRVTRTGQEPPGQYQYTGQPAYVVNVRFSAENASLSGTAIPYTYRYLDWEKGYQQFFTVSAPVSTLRNDVFDSQSLPIPPLAPGESITIPLSLTPHTYYIPEHLHSLMIELNARDLEIGDVGGIGGSRGTLFDWLCLHNGGEIKIEASVSCLSVPSGLIGSTSPDEDAELVPCGSDAEPFIYQETSDVCYP